MCTDIWPKNSCNYHAVRVNKISNVIPGTISAMYVTGPFRYVHWEGKRVQECLRCSRTRIYSMIAAHPNPKTSKTKTKTKTNTIILNGVKQRSHLIIQDVVVKLLCPRENTYTLLLFYFIKSTILQHSTQSVRRIIKYSTQRQQNAFFCQLRRMYVHTNNTLQYHTVHTYGTLLAPLSTYQLSGNIF